MMDLVYILYLSAYSYNVSYKGHPQPKNVLYKGYYNMLLYQDYNLLSKINLVGNYFYLYL